MSRVVVNSTPLIVLAIVGHLGLLQSMFDEIVVPASVYQECVVQGQGKPGAATLEKAQWIRVQAPQAQPALPPSFLGLDEGELDTILLAQELQADWVLIDEKLGRKVAKALNLPVQGTLGLLLAAYRAGLLTQEEARTAAATLRDSAVRLSPRLMHWFEAQLITED